MEGVRYAIFDVDDVLIDTDTAEVRARRELRAALDEPLGTRLGSAVYEGFLHRWQVVVDWQQGAILPRDPRFQATYGEICQWQRGVTDAGYEVKIWSRDAMLAAAFEAAGVEPTGRMLESVLGRYWRALAEGTEIFADAACTLRALEDRSVRIHLATNSDGHLVFDDRAQTLSYDPERAARRKRSRLGRLTDLGLTARDLTVGDPIGKPDVRFCHQVVRDFSAKLGSEIALEETVVLGDSLGSDILPFLEVGAARGFWLRRDSERGRKSRESVPEKVTPIRSLEHML